MREWQVGDEVYWLEYTCSRISESRVCWVMSGKVYAKRSSYFADCTPTPGAPRPVSNCNMYATCEEARKAALNFLEAFKKKVVSALNEEIASYVKCP